MVEEWGVSKTTGQCAVTGRPLAEGDVYYAVLFETPEGFERKDYSQEAWTGPPEGAFCYWRGRIPARESKPDALAVDLSLLTQLFLRLEDETAQIKQQLRFVLALLLMRKRQLRLVRTVREADGEYWLLTLTSDKSEHKVLNPRLDEATIERLSGQLTAILSGDVEAIESLGTPAETAGSVERADAIPGDGTISATEPARAEEAVEPPFPQSRQTE